MCAHIRARSLHGIEKLPIGARERSAYTHIPKIGLQEPQGACMSSPVKKVWLNPLISADLLVRVRAFEVVFMRVQR